MKKKPKKYQAGTYYFLSKLPTYEPWSVLIRVLIISVIGVLTIRFLASVTDVPLSEFLWTDYLHIIISFNVLSESIIITDMILERYLPVPDKLRFRIIAQTILSIILSTVIYYIAVAVLTGTLHEEKEISDNLRRLSMGFGLVFTIFLVSSLLMTRLVDKWMFAQSEIEELKREKLKMDYNALQDQLNPHYLFNNLSVLKSLILYDKDSAVKFTENFTDVYRYVLQSRNKMTVKLKDELVFMNAFVGTHQERLGDGLIVKASVNKDLLSREIPPLTMQLLIENAIKHNIASTESPLRIDVLSKGRYLVLKNNIQLKDTSYSTQTGLKNLVKRYAILTKHEVVIQNKDGIFKVKVPLL